MSENGKNTDNDSNMCGDSPNSENQGNGGNNHSEDNEANLNQVESAHQSSDGPQPEEVALKNSFDDPLMMQSYLEEAIIVENYFKTKQKKRQIKGRSEYLGETSDPFKKQLDEKLLEPQSGPSGEPPYKIDDINMTKTYLAIVPEEYYCKMLHNQGVNKIDQLGTSVESETDTTSDDVKPVNQ